MPAKIYEFVEEKYYDKVIGRHIAIKTVKYKGKMRPMMIAYNDHPNQIEIVTIHPLKKGQKDKDNRIKVGRWVKYE